MIFLIFFIVLIKLGFMKYWGGGDWYFNFMVLFNLVFFCNNVFNINFNIVEYVVVEVGSVEFYNYFWIYMMGYGNVVFFDVEVDNLCNYLLVGGFLYIDDNYGMDFFVCIVMKKVFFELDFIEFFFEYFIYY